MPHIFYRADMLLAQALLGMLEHVRHLPANQLADDGRLKLLGPQETMRVPDLLGRAMPELDLF